MVVIVGKNKILVLRLWPLTKEVLNTQVDILCSVGKNSESGNVFAKYACKDLLI